MTVESLLFSGAEAEALEVIVNRKESRDPLMEEDHMRQRPLFREIKKTPGEKLYQEA